MVRRKRLCECSGDFFRDVVGVRDLASVGADGGEVVGQVFFFFFTLVTGPRRSLSFKLSDTRVYAP